MSVELPNFLQFFPWEYYYFHAALTSQVQFEGWVLCSLLALALYIHARHHRASTWDSCAHTKCSKKEQLVDGVWYKHQSLLIIYNSFIILNLFIACKRIIICIGCGYCSRAEFILFNASERMGAGKIRGREVLKETRYYTMINIEHSKSHVLKHANHYQSCIHFTV